MTAPLLAFSLSNKLLDAGAVAAFAALLGIAVLSLLVFSQARELKRLREWAGRAPERAAELEQRVSADAAARVQRTVQPVPRPAGAVVPRATPVVSRAAAAAGPATQVASGVAVTAAGQSAPPVPGQPGAPPVPVAAPATATPVPGQPAFVPSVAPASASAQAVPVAEPEKPAEESKPEGSPEPADDAKPGDAEQPPQSPAAAEAPRPVPAAASNGAQSEPVQVEESRRIAPATAASAAIPASAVVSARPKSAPPRAPAPPAPAKPAAAQPPRPPLPPRPAAAARSGTSARALSGPEFQFLREEERSPRKATALIVGGVAVGVLVLAAILLSSGGSNGKSTPGSTAASSSAAAKHTHGSHRARTSSGSVAGPAETHVVVLNATETNGLAHRLSASLQQSGYAQAAALSANPPSARSTSVVEYASGHRPEAQHVAQALGIAQLAPLEEAIAPLVGGATVVVLAGSDQAALAGASQGGGEAANGAAPPAGGEAANGAAAPAGGEAAANGG